MLHGDAANLYEIKKTSGLDISSDLISDAFEKLKDQKLNWMVLKYADSNRLELFRSELSPLSAMVALLDPALVLYGCFNITT